MNTPISRPMNRRSFLRSSATALAAGGASSLLAQLPGDRPAAAAGVSVIHPRGRVPVGLIIDDSTALVNLNRFAMPQFDATFAGANDAYHQPWRDWPAEIPDAFVRKFGEWAAEHGVKGKYSMVPFPACVGRLDRMLPGWTQRELGDSLELVRTVMMPNWDIHPEMITHTRVIDLKTGHPYPDFSPKFMENWEWTNGRSADELAAYMAYGLGILKNAGLPVRGDHDAGRLWQQGAAGAGAGDAAVGARGVRRADSALFPPPLRHGRAERGAARGVREPGWRRRTRAASSASSAARATGPGGWDCREPAGVDRFITEDLQRGRVVEVIERGEPAIMVCHWTGIYWNGRELGFEVFKEVVRRLTARYDHLLWMKLSEVARYWAARELTRVERDGESDHVPCAVRVPGLHGALRGARHCGAATAPARAARRR